MKTGRSEADDRIRHPPAARSRPSNQLEAAAEPEMVRESDNAVLRLQALADRRGASGPGVVAQGFGLAPPLQRSPRFDKVKVDADAKKTPSEADLEAATKELIGEYLAADDYRDADGKPVTSAKLGTIAFHFGEADYSASADRVDLPSAAECAQDIRKGHFVKSVLHEMSHYVRTIGAQTEQQSFPDVEAVIAAQDWGKLAKAHAHLQPLAAYWQEEVRADLRSIQLAYNHSGVLPSKGDTASWGGTFGGGDASHPPSALRIRLMNTYVSRIKPGRGRCCCFLTTACVTKRGLPDDCEELTVLRQFRDGYLQNKPGGPDLIEAYYQCSPMIVDAVDERPDQDFVYGEIYDVIADCVRAIGREEFEYAYRRYCSMVVDLADRFLPPGYLPDHAV